MENMERICDICGKPHPTNQHEEWAKVEAIKKASLEKLHKGEPGIVEAQKETQREGMLIEPGKEHKFQDKIFKGKGPFEKLREENIRKLREGVSKKDK